MNFLKKGFLVSILSISFLWPGMGFSESIKVGAAINLTGPISSWGKYHAKGQQDYFRYVNEEKGGVNGKKIEMILVDTAYKVTEAVAAVRKFAVQDKVDMIATWSTGEGLAAKPVIQNYKIPTINYSSGWEILEAPIEYMYLPFASYRLDPKIVLDYILAIHKGNEPPKVGLLTYNNAYGRSVHEPTKEYAAKKKVNIVAIEEFPPKTVDLSTEVLRLQKAGAEYIFMQLTPTAIIAALRSADRINYNPPFFGTWTSTDVDFFKMGQGLIRNRLKMQFFGCLPSDKNKGSELMQELIKRYKTVDKFDTSYWVGVVMGSIMERAMVRADEKYKAVNSKTINDAMESFRNEDFGGLLPPVTYTKSNHEPFLSGRMVSVNEDGSYTPLTNFYVPEKEQIKLLR